MGKSNNGSSKESGSDSMDTSKGSGSSSVTKGNPTKRNIVGKASSKPKKKVSHEQSTQSRGPNDIRGRPLYDFVHKHQSPSLLSHRNKALNVRGLFNLVFIILFVQNARLVIENLMKYGVRIRPIPPSSIDDLIENWPILLSLILMHGSFFFAFVLEKYINPQLVRGSRTGSSTSSLFLTVTNAILVLLIPYFTLRLHYAEPLSATALLAFSITWFLKLWSFHHVMMDVRFAQAQGELTHTEIGPCKLHFSHFYVFLIMPTMCFQFEYPRTPKIRWFSIVKHLIEMAVCLALMKIIIEQYIEVTVRNTFVSVEQLQKMRIIYIFAHLSERILKLSVPNLYVWLLMFLALFHHWLNILGEITRFADREFYLDWWNASSFDEYWRKWNLPIHKFLNRHINKPLLREGVPKAIAGQLVFIVSALAHEYMACVPLRIGWTGLIFTGFIAQIPLMYLTSVRFFKRHPTVGNVFFWTTFCFTGQPLAILFYYYLWGVKQGAVPEVDLQQLQQMVHI